ncbi:MAG: hypothetical protein OXH05_10585 [Acidobacteria bacterium]|nr:hypothetical protein [Alphaproteobacteria bacterium]MCY3746663.1 hypothetical protein [Acidobacteriota bacterium]
MRNATRHCQCWQIEYRAEPTTGEADPSVPVIYRDRLHGECELATMDAAMAHGRSLWPEFLPMSGQCVFRADTGTGVQIRVRENHTDHAVAQIWKVTNADVHRRYQGLPEWAEYWVYFDLRTGPPFHGGGVPFPTKARATGFATRLWQARMTRKDAAAYDAAVDFETARQAA